MNENAKIPEEIERLKTENAMQEQTIKAHEKSVIHLKWALGIVIVFVGFMVFKSSHEYREALQDAREAAKETREVAKEARLAADKAKEWEQSTQEISSKIEVVVNQKLEEVKGRADEVIKSKSEEAIKRISDVAEEERKKNREESEKRKKINDLWNKGMRAIDEGRYGESCSYWQEIITIDPNDYETWDKFGEALFNQAQTKKGAEADRLFEQSYEKYRRAMEVEPNGISALGHWIDTLSQQAQKKEESDANKLLAELCDKYQKMTEIAPDNYQAWYNWGGMLAWQAQKRNGTEADELFAEACSKLQKAIEIAPKFESINALNTWANILLEQAKKKEGAEKQKLLQEAKEKFLKAEQIFEGAGAYELARLAAIEGNEEECKKWLKTGEETGRLPPKEYVMKDEKFKVYWDKNWFKTIKWSSGFTELKTGKGK